MEPVLSINVLEALKYLNRQMSQDHGTSILFNPALISKLFVLWRAAEFHREHYSIILSDEVC